VQSAEHGALPVLRAATDPFAEGGEYYGPSGRGQFTGDPVRVPSSTRSHDRTAAYRLWALSEQFTAVGYRFSTAGSPG
jgi:hypothetical protein